MMLIERSTIHHHPVLVQFYLGLTQHVFFLLLSPVNFTLPCTVCRNIYRSDQLDLLNQISTKQINKINPTSGKVKVYIKHSLNATVLTITVSYK